MGIHRCMVKGCRVTVKNKSPLIKIHILPKDARTRALWIEKFRQWNGDDYNFSNKIGCCTNHFDMSDVSYVKNRPFITRRAVPVFLQNNDKIRSQHPDVRSAKQSSSSLTRNVNNQQLHLHHPVVVQPPLPTTTTITTPEEDYGYNDLDDLDEDDINFDEDYDDGSDDDDLDDDDELMRMPLEVTPEISISAKGPSIDLTNTDDENENENDMTEQSPVDDDIHGGDTDFSFLADDSQSFLNDHENSDRERLIAANKILNKKLSSLVQFCNYQNKKITHLVKRNRQLIDRVQKVENSLYNSRKRETISSSYLNLINKK